MADEKEAIQGKKGRREGPGGKDEAAPKEGTEVGGRYSRGTWVICPHCGSRRWIVEETTGYQWYTCGNCGNDYYY